MLLKAKRYIGIDSGILHLNMMVGTPATIFCAAYEQGGRSKQIKAIHKNLDVESIVLKAEELLENIDNRRFRVCRGSSSCSFK